MFYLNKDVRLFSREYRRMCESFDSCSYCPLGFGLPTCKIGSVRNTDKDDEKILLRVQRWTDREGEL